MNPSSKVASLLVILSIAALAPAQFGGKQWSAGPDVNPGRNRHAMVYDSVRGRIVSFGGYDGHGATDHTFEFDGVAWTRKFPTTSPAATYHQVMAFDEARGVTVMFDGSGIGSHTWVYDGTTWTEKFPAHTPPSRVDSVMAYDPERAVSVLFGGQSGLADTWEWNGVDWKQVLVSGPSMRSGAMMSFDPTRHRVVMYGGRQEWDNVMFSDMWEFDGVSWRLIPTPTVGIHPGAMHGAGMVFDPQLGGLVMMGGVGQTAGYLGQTWLFKGSRWFRLASGNAQFPRAALFGCAYFPPLGATVVYGTAPDSPVRRRATYLFKL